MCDPRCRARWLRPLLLYSSCAVHSWAAVSSVASAPTAVMSSPLWRAAAPGFDAPFRAADHATREAALRAEELVDPAVAGTLHDGREYGGLVVLRGAVGTHLTAQMRRDAEALLDQGRLTTTGTGEPDDSGRSDPLYEKFFGKRPILSFLSGQEARSEGLLGLTYGFAIFCGLCAALNRHAPKGSPLVEPSPRMQLACYDGGGARYGEHTDWCASEDLEADGEVPDGVHDRGEIGRRRISALLYLQESWREEWGGALRMHGSTDGHSDASPCVDVMPESGSIVLFRSRGPVHEVLQTSHRRFALTMWLLDAER